MGAVRCSRLSLAAFRKLMLARIICVTFMFGVVTSTPSIAQVLTTLVDFDESNGANPWSPLIQANDGNFYGTTFDGGGSQNGGGTIFRMTSSGTVNALYS